MPYGFQVIGSHGKVIIDSEVQCFKLKANGSVSASANTENQISFSGASRPALFVSSAAAVAVTKYSLSGGVATYTLVAASAATVKWYAFDVPTLVAGNGGLQIFDSAGKLTFDSNATPLVIASVTQLQNELGNGSWPPPAGSVTLPASSYAACVSCPRSWVAYSGSGATTFASTYMDGVSTTSTSASTGHVFVFGEFKVGFGTTYNQGVGGKLIVADVSMIP